MTQSSVIAVQRPPSTWATDFVLTGAVLFNAFLALINANAIGLNSSEVIGFEAVIDAAAIGLSLRRRDPMQQRWIALAIFIVVVDLVNAIGSGFDPKFLRDALIIPIFVLLGLTSDRDSAIRVIVRLQWIVLIVMMFEAIRPDDFGRIFNVTLYYINTRGFEQSQFWSQDASDLFVSAMRPGERFLMAFLNIHRLSSVFLEPVSLGNYCVIVTMVLVSLWDRIGLRDRVFLAISSAMILVGCDGRFATTTILIVIAMRFVAPALPRYVNVIYLPGMLIAAWAVVSWAQLTPGGDDFPTRTAGSIVDLSQMDVLALLGAEGSYAYQVMDSGIAYLLYSQSVIGAAAIWIVVALGLPQRDRASIVFSHTASIYVVLNLLISYSMFSIKTAALLWFVFGALARATSAREAPAAVQRPFAASLRPQSMSLGEAGLSRGAET